MTARPFAGRVQGTFVFRAAVDNMQPFPPAATEAERIQLWTEQWAGIAEWTRACGVESAVALAVFHHDGRYLLCVTEVVKDAAGNPVWDWASDRPATTYRILDIGTEPTWPDHFNHAHYTALAGSWL